MVCNKCTHKDFCKYEEWFREFEKRMDEFVLNYDGPGGPPGAFVNYKIECAGNKNTPPVRLSDYGIPNPLMNIRPHGCDE